MDLHGRQAAPISALRQVAGRAVAKEWTRARAPFEIRLDLGNLKLQAGLGVVDGGRPETRAYA
jgi:hypothetical protein